MNETSPLSLQHLSSPLFLSISFVLVSFWYIPSLIWLWRRGAIENLVQRVFMVDSVVRWLSQRRMLIRQPRLRLIWLAAVTPSSCSQSVPRLFLPLHCSTASFLSLALSFSFLKSFSSFYIEGHLFILGLVFLAHKVMVYFFIHTQPWRSFTYWNVALRLFKGLSYFSPS